MKKSVKRALFAAIAALSLSAPAFAVINSETYEIIVEGAPEELRAALATGLIKMTDRDANGNTPFMLNVEWNAVPENTEIFLKAGGKVNDRNNDGQTPLMLCARDNPNEEIIEALCLAGAEVNAIDKHAATALMKSAEWGNPESFLMLLKYGADIFAMDDQQRTVLDYAHAGKFDYMIGIVEHEFRTRREQAIARRPADKKA